MARGSSLSSFERSLQNLIHVYKTSHLITESLQKSKDFDQPNLVEQKALINFLKQIQAWPLLFKLLKKWIRMELPIAWGSVAEVLAQLNKKNDEIAQILMLGAQAQSLELELATCYQFDNLLPALKKYRLQSIDGLFDQKAKHQQQMWDQFLALRTQGMIQPATKLLQDLLRFDPLNQIYKQAFNEIRIEQAYSLVDQKKLHQPLRNWIKKELNPSGDAQLYLNNLQNQKLSSQQLREFIYFGAIHFLQIDQVSTALELINNLADLQVSEQWLKFEILLSLGHWLEALNLIESIASSHPNDPDIQIATQYEKSLVLWNLHQKNEAINLMQHLISFEPDYRQAQYWLDHWRRDAKD